MIFMTFMVKRFSNRLLSARRQSPSFPWSGSRFQARKPRFCRLAAPNDPAIRTHAVAPDLRILQPGPAFRRREDLSCHGLW